MASVIFSHMSVDKLFKCLHNDESHVGECTEKPAFSVSIAPSQRCATPHHKPKTSWKEIVYTKKIQGPKHQNHYRKWPLEYWLQNSQGESKSLHWFTLHW